MKILFWGSALFGFAFLVHLAVWKIRLPQRQTKVLLQLLFGILAAGILLFANLPPATALFRQTIPHSFLEYLHISLFFVSLTLSYMITYSALEADSPTLVMVLTVAQAGPAGLPTSRFYELMTDEVLVKPRIRDLVKDRMAYEDGGKYRLTRKGLLFARIFMVHRNLLKAQKGG